MTKRRTGQLALPVNATAAARQARRKLREADLAKLNAALRVEEAGPAAYRRVVLISALRRKRDMLLAAEAEAADEEAEGAEARARSKRRPPDDVEQLPRG
jgi:hypothetical protein